jgi:hypothetical protein
MNCSSDKNRYEVSIKQNDGSNLRILALLVTGLNPERVGGSGASLIRVITTPTTQPRTLHTYARLDFPLAQVIQVLTGTDWLMAIMMAKWGKRYVRRQVNMECSLHSPLYTLY